MMISVCFLSSFRGSSRGLFMSRGAGLAVSPSLKLHCQLVDQLKPPWKFGLALGSLPGTSVRPLCRDRAVWTLVWSLSALCGFSFSSVLLKLSQTVMPTHSAVHLVRSAEPPRLMCVWSPDLQSLIGHVHASKDQTVIVCRLRADSGCDADHCWISLLRGLQSVLYPP